MTGPDITRAREATGADAPQPTRAGTPEPTRAGADEPTGGGPHEPADAGAPDPVERWQRRLSRHVGMSEPERRALRAGLDEFCSRHGVDPATLLLKWETYPELTVRRRPRCGEPANLAVESFLIHNGVNVFGDLVCVPGSRPSDLADQGERFTRHLGTGRRP